MHHRRRGKEVDHGSGPFNSLFEMPVDVVVSPHRQGDVVGLSILYLRCGVIADSGGRPVLVAYFQFSI